MYKIGFIGTGNMGGALALAACRTIGSDKVCVSDYDPSKALQFSNENGCTAFETNIELAKNAYFIVLAVKPNIIRDVVSAIKDTLLSDRSEGKDHVIVTIAAGVEKETIEKCIDGCFPVIRIMPNTPVAVGQGMILITGNPENKDLIDDFKQTLSGAGDFLETAEKNFDLMTGVSSCAPAYAYMFIESLADGAVQVGVPRDQAIMLAAKTVLGSAQMVLETGEHPDKLKDNVCSPGGSTIAGVHALEQNNFRYAAAQSIIAATEKNLSLGK